MHCPSSSLLTRNGELHEYRLDGTGRRIGLKEYHPPQSSNEDDGMLSFLVTLDTVVSSRVYACMGMGIGMGTGEGV